MEDKELHDWMIASFGPLQGEAAYAQFSQLPDSIKDQILAQGVEHLPKPEEVHDLVQAFTDGGINTMSDVDKVVQSGPINLSLAKSLAVRKARENSVDTVSAAQAQQTRDAMSTVNLWLDSASAFDPAPGTIDVVTPSGWAEATMDSWTKLAQPVAKSMNEALASVFADRLGGTLDGEVSSMFAGPVPIPIPEGLKDPHKLMELLGSTSFAMQLGQASGTMAHEVFGSFDQGLVMTANPAGALLPENIEKFAKELEIPLPEALSFLALRESAHSRLYNAVPWLMPRVESLISKYARGISIDLDAVEEQLRDANEMNPEGIAGAVNMAKVGMKETDEQKEALHSLEILLALVEGWVDCVTWRAGAPFLPHIEQLREMMRRRRAAGGPAEQTFENLIGLKLRPRKLREAAAVWERLTAQESVDDRDAHWSHPDRLPVLEGAPVINGTSTPAISDEMPSDADAASETLPSNDSADADDAGSQDHPAGSATGSVSSVNSDADTPEAPKESADWDAELAKLLEEEEHKGDDASGTSDENPEDQDPKE
ncbi:MAG: zinc-dependent metalloprotease [Bifidobacteriaceae bacterium]|jgi:putative hydrolase|nr:zinc-dependent metalloprotease [Bifidobacteriaceae bacterium]